MSFSKINYKDNETIITADNLNDIQDAILEGYQPDGTIEYTAFAESTKLALLNLIYPIGSIYMSVDDISPASQFGGTWERLKDRFLLGAGDAYSAGSTGGESEHKLTQDEMPKHFHSGYLLGMGGTGTTPAYYAALNQSAYTYDYERGVSGVLEVAIAASKGGNQPHNNMPPYLAVYMWKRIADIDIKEEDKNENENFRYV